ncbi:MAG: cysteine desulfurase [Candidatus Thermoplasmatota archaeon]|nr:cysteine desulfurase [Euryarchaeota archaeon]MBU4031463.1 cysteine desulfurase [Candidatus Thermoplasmatota archaeon]MBU4070771.1 cysteine desulfurase [Candidatus Thermoplasmatota archaeon]MBU4144680.1 cysteine desulfurase [Candidatus Thermoplasmatota archaeon]MBU4592759.1 cysteine desulfurase [Candidatus Thermoplasmatota archaeon]
MKRIYMDHSGTTPIDPRVLEAMMPFLTEKFANPSSIYTEGREVRASLDQARVQVAKALNADAGEITFTSGGTESDNLGIKGIALGRKEKGGHIITTTIEHHAVTHTVDYLGENGFDISFLPVNKYGQVELETLENEIRDDTFLLSLVYGNNEIGTIQDMRDIVKLAHKHDVLVHTDAVQAVAKIPIDVKDLGVDLLSLSGHKIYGPKGIGALYARKGLRLAAVQHGGGHEKNLRSGTENVAGVIGLGKAMEIGEIGLTTEIPRVKAMRDRLVKCILSELEDSYLNGHPEKRLPHNAHFRFSYIEGEALLLNLDMMGIVASTGSACSSKSLKASHVLLAIGLTPEQAHGSLRLTLGKGNTDEEIDTVLEAVPKVVKKLRAMSPLGHGGGK